MSVTSTLSNVVDKDRVLDLFPHYNGYLCTVMFVTFVVTSQLFSADVTAPAEYLRHPLGVLNGKSRVLHSPP